MTRKEAIEEFSSHARYSDIEHFLENINKQQTVPDLMWTLNSNKGFKVSVYEFLGTRTTKTKNSDEDLSPVRQILTRYFTQPDVFYADSFKVSLRDLIKNHIVDHALKVHKTNKIQEVFNLEQSEEDLRSSYEYNPIIDGFVQNLVFDITSLPNQMEINNETFHVGSSFYRVWGDAADSVHGIKIHEYKVCERRFADMGYDEETGKHKIYVVNKAFQLNTKHNRNPMVRDSMIEFLTVPGQKIMSPRRLSRHSYVNGKSVDGTFFTCKYEAQQFVDQQWKRIEKNRQNYLLNKPRYI